MADPARRFQQPHERTAQLHELGLSETTIHDAVVRGFVARQTCTAFDPPSYPGTVQWAQTHRALRELMVPLSWTPEDSQNYSRIVNPEQTIAVTVATGDDFTGIKSEKGHEKPEPRTKYPKGSETTLRVETNVRLGQLTLWPQARSIIDKPVLDGAPQVLWVLLITADEQEIRYELSRPEGQDEAGRVVSWHSRIVFDPVEIASISTEATNRREEDDEDEGGLDVPVERI